MATKTYELMPHMDSDAPVYQTTAEGQRVQVKKIPFYDLQRRYSFSDEKGVRRVIRYLRNSKFIDQDKQVEVEKVPANDPFSPNEKQDLRFRFGNLTTDDERAQEYIESTPEFNGFKGRCESVRQPTFQLIDTVNEAKVFNDEARLRAKAMSRIYDLNLAQAHEMLIRLNGSHFTPPNDVETCWKMLVSFVDDSDGLAAAQAVLKDDSEITEDEKITVLLGKLLSAELLKFDVVSGSIQKKDKTGNWIDVKEIHADDLDEMKRLFSEHLLSNKGKNLLADLEKDLSINDKKNK